MAKIKENDHAEAIELLTIAIDEDANNADYYSERAVCYIHTGQLDLSMFDMNRAVEIEPDYSYRYSCRAYLKGKMGDARGAVADYQRAVELDPEDAIAYNNLGLAQENLGYWEKARENFRKSNQLIGYDPENRVIQGDVAISKDNQEIKITKDEIVEPVIQPTKGQIIKDVFSKKGTFKEFVGFITNGFKLKKDDKS